MEIPKKLIFAGIMVAEVVSNKADRKESVMRAVNQQPNVPGGRYLTREDNRRFSAYRRVRRCRRYLTVAVLLFWDGLLLYMIFRCFIVPVYGAVFVAAVSVCLGYQFNQEV